MNGNKRLQGLQRLQAVTRGYKGLQGDRKGCRRLQGVKTDYKELQVIKVPHKVTPLHFLSEASRGLKYNFLILFLDVTSYSTHNLEKRFGWISTWSFL